jgi:hypothetical protein
MFDDMETAYHAALNGAAIPFDPVEQPGDWHLRFFELPANGQETVWDLDYREGRALFYQVRFVDSVWLALHQAKANKGKVQPISSIRRCCALPHTHPLVGLVSDEAVYRLARRECILLDDTHYMAVQTSPSQVVQADAWQGNLDAGWERLLLHLQEATRLLPKA